jgi:hypothetical protein
VAAASFAALLAEFVAARDTLLRNPDSTLASYKALVGEYAARTEPESLSLDDLARGAFEGLFDLPPGREKAAARAQALLSPESIEGARAASVRLRLLGDVTIAGRPAPAVQEPLVRDLLVHPQFGALLASDHGPEALDSLLGTGRTAVLRPYRDQIVAAVRRLDPHATPERAADLESLALLLALAIKDEASLREEVRRLLEFGREALKSNLPPPVRKQASQAVAWFESFLRPPPWKAAKQQTERSERETVSTQGFGSVFKPGGSLLEALIRELNQGVEGAMRVGGSVALRTTIDLPRQRTLFHVPDSWYEQSRWRRFEARDAVSAHHEQLLRSFGGISVVDPIFGMRARDFGLDRATRLFFVRDASAGGELIRVRAASAVVTREEASAQRIRAGLGLGNLALFRIDVRQLALQPGGSIKANDIGLRLLGMRIAGIGSVSTRAKPASDSASADNAPADNVPEEPAKPKGRSPLYRWLKPPSLGVEEGGVSIRYNNALKFGGRITAATSFKLATAVPSSVSLGVNYNLLNVTNDLDQFLGTPFLQNKFLGAFMYEVRNQEPLRENEQLFRRKLFVGASTAWNVQYEDQDGTRRNADLPFSLGIGGGTPIGHMLGFRGQLNYERLDDQDFGSETRLALTSVLGLREVEVARGVNLFVRGESTARFGEETYTWFRANSGLTVLTIPNLRLSGSYYQAWEAGTPRFPYDQVAADHGVSARIDVTIGRTRVGFMNQYSTRRDGWIRAQFYVARKVGVAELYLSHDQQFDSYSFGLNLDTASVFDRLRRRRVTGIEAPSPP